MTQIGSPGSVTFLFTDVAGSTLLWEEAPEQMRTAMTRHDALVEQAVVEAGGRLVRPRGEGDSRFAVFGQPVDAVRAAVAVQRALASEPWITPRPVSVRVAVHTGVAQLRDDDYYGADVNRCARLRSIGHPRQILLTSATTEVVSAQLAGELALRDLGVHRLKDVPHPEHVYQVVHPGLQAEFPPLLSPGSVDLPHALDSFHGRKPALEQVAGFLTTGHRLVTLTGPGGVGKSRLAAETAAAVAEDFSAGVQWVSLAAVREPEAVIPAVAEALRTTPAELVDAVGSARRLLVLDNMEQVVDAAPEIIGLLAQCPGLAALVTSREPLDIAGETPYRVAPLAESEAIELFCARAQRPASPTIAELCRRLDHLPLAVELAATRARSLTPDQILERLGQRLDLLRAPRAVDPRQRTLRATIAWSYELLSPDEQQAFRALAVIPASFSLEAAEAVVSADVDDLDALVSKSLVVYAEGRYSMLETIAEFARERLAEDADRAAYERAFAAWMARLVEAQDQRVRGPEQLDALAILDADRDNIYAAMEMMLADPDPTGAQRLGRHATWWMSRRGRRVLLSRWLESALSRPGGALADRGWALLALLSVVGSAADPLNRHASWDELDRLAEAASDELLAATALEHRAFRTSGPEALAFLREAAARFRQLGAPDEHARVLINLGAVALNEGDYEQAVAASREAAAEVARLGNQHGVGNALLNTAMGLVALSCDEEAASALREAVDALDAVQDEVGAVMALRVAALLEGRRGRWQQAQVLRAVAEESWPRLGLELEPSDRELQAALDSVLGEETSVPEAAPADGQVRDLIVAWRRGEV